MSKTISLNKSVKIDLPKLIEGGMVILANSGGGKSYAIRRIAEQAVKHVQVIILDPEGEFASLRTKFDFILAGKDADVPVEVRSAGLLATKLLQLGTSAVVDLYELHPQERQRFVKLFCEALVNCPKELYHPVLIVLDEAHEYVPEGKPSEATYAVESLASKGRKRGQRLILASQRISKLSKNAAAECNNKLIGRASQDIDMKRAGDELGFNKENTMQLRQLKPGEFFAFGPAISDDVTKIKVGDVETAHAKVSYKGSVQTPPPTAAIKKILGELADLPKEAEKELKTTKELKAELTAAKRHITQLEKNPGNKVPKEFEESNRRLAEAHSVVLKENETLQKEVKEWKEYAGLLEVQMRSFQSTATHVLQDRPKGVLVMKIKDSGKSRAITFTGPYKPEAPLRLSKMIDQVVTTEEMSLGKGENAILNAIAQYPEGITNEHIAILTGYKKTSRRVYLQKLTAGGFVVQQGDNYVVTEVGTEALGSNFEPLPTGPELLQHWLVKLPEGEKKILTAFLDSMQVGENALTRQEIAEATGYKKTSVRVYVQKLLARKLLKAEGDLLAINDNLL